MLFKIFMMIVFFSCILIMYIMYFNETKPKKNIILGATIPYTHINDDKVREIVKNYKKLSTYTFLGLTIVLLPSAFLSVSGNMCYSMTWMVLGILIQTLPYIHANKQLKQYKKDNGLHGTITKMADLKLTSVDIKAASPLLSLIPFFISAAPIIYLLIKKPNSGYGSIVFPLAIMSGTILLCMGIHIVINKRKKDVVSEDTNINYSLSIIRTRNWSRVFIGLNFLMAIMSVLIFCDFTFENFSSSLTFIIIMILSLLSVAYVMYLEFDTRKKQYKYTTENTEKDGAFLDEDDYWIWGLFYYNPKDKRLVIPDRVGSNTGVNLAKPAGKILMAFCGLIMAAMPFLGGYFVLADNTPMTVEFTDTAIVATHMSVDYNIPLIDIVDMEETPIQPKLTNKINGWGTDKVRKGKFGTKNYGVCEIFIPADANDFFIIKTKDKTYIFGKVS